MLVSGKNPRGKKPHPWGVSGRVTVRLGIGLDLGSGSFFPGGFFPTSSENGSRRWTLHAGFWTLDVKKEYRKKFLLGEIELQQKRLSRTVQKSRAIHFRKFLHKTPVVESFFQSTYRLTVHSSDLLYSMVSPRKFSWKSFESFRSN